MVEDVVRRIEDASVLYIAIPICRTHSWQVLCAFASDGAKASQARMTRPSLSKAWRRNAPTDAIGHITLLVATPPTSEAFSVSAPKTQTLGASRLGNQHTKMLQDAHST